MNKKSNGSHTMQIPEWVWKWAQDKTGLANPATHLRNLLLETISDLKNAETPQKTANPQQHKNLVSIEKYRDASAHAFQARRDSICRWCKKTMKQGDTIVACEQDFFHASCYDQIVDKLS